MATTEVEKAESNVLNLADLEEETNSILERYGKSSKHSRSSRKLPSSPGPYSPKRRDGMRSLTHTAFNRSYRVGHSATKKNRPHTTDFLQSPYNSSKVNDVGSPPNKLRNAISSALSGTKFDSVPSLLVGDLSGDLKQSPKRSTSIFSKQPSSLALRDVHPGFDSVDDKKRPNAADLEKEVCFNCWSAGQGLKCTIHAKGSSDSIGQRISMICSNWDISYLRRKYRAEEIQEVFLAQSQSLVYDKNEQQFSINKEARHEIYHLVDQHVQRLNFIYQRRQNTKVWLKSFISKLKEGSFQNNRSARSAKTLCFRATEKNMAQVRQLSVEMKDKLPKAPVTGTTMNEKLGKEKILIERVVKVDGVDTTYEFVIAGPTPVPQALYQPRKYDSTSPVKFILPQVETRSSTDELNELDFMALLKDPKNFIEYAIFSRKGAANLAVGGLSTQMLVSKQFTKAFPPQYKDLTCMYDAVMTPPKRTTPSNVPTLQVPPGDLPYVHCNLVTPLDKRKPPTIMTKVGIDLDNRHHFGLNRVEQTGEEGDCGFRTSTWAYHPPPNSKIDTNTFKPSESIATPNETKVTAFQTFRADATYPFCREKSITNRVEDLYHLLLSNGEQCTSNKLQVFTTIGSQQLGFFLQNGDASLPIGRMNTKVVRTWAFLQGEADQKEPNGDDDPSNERICKKENMPLETGVTVFNSRSRKQSMPEGVLFFNSRPNVRDAILHTEEGKMDNGLDVSLDRPLVDGLLGDIARRRVCSKHAEYLPLLLNLPSLQFIDAKKPKTSSEEWAAEGYNPWAEGKNLFSTHFVCSLTHETKRWPKVNHNKEIPLESNTDKEFAALCSLVRHGKFRDLEDTLNNQEWSLPIDYVDENGNSLLMIACQNGNRRIVKLCLRRGCQINKQNGNGNSCLHFAFGYGFGEASLMITRCNKKHLLMRTLFKADLGDYLISKGADDSITNVNGLTCYEGLDIDEI